MYIQKQNKTKNNAIIYTAVKKDFDDLEKNKVTPDIHTYIDILKQLVLSYYKKNS